MGKSRKKSIDRILSTALSIALTTCYVPTSAFAETGKSKAALARNTTDNGKKIISEQKQSDEEYNLHFNVAGDFIDNVAISLNGVSTNDVASKIGDTISFRAVTNNDSCRFRSVKIGDVSVFDDIKGKNEYENSFVFTQEMASGAGADGNIEISVEVAQAYKTTFSFDASCGKVIESDNELSANGIVYKTEGDKFEFTVIPDTDYRVAEIKIDEDVKTYTENSNIVKETIDSSKDHNVDVYFEKNQYKVSVDEEIQHCNIVVSNDVVESGGESTIEVNADNGYYINNILVNGEPVSAEQIKENVFSIKDIKEDKSVYVEVSEYGKSLEHDFLFNSDSALFIDGNNISFNNTTNAVFSTQKDGIRLLDENNEIIKGDETTDTIIINENVKISAVELYYAESEGDEPSWHRIDFEREIMFNKGVEASISLPPSENRVYNSDVKLTLDIADFDDPDMKIEKIEYWVDNEPKHKKFDDVSKREIVIPAKEYNRGNMKVNVIITDSDYNVTRISSDEFSINTIVPEISVLARGEIKEGANEGYFASKRLITVTVKDLDYTFDNTFDYFKIKKNGVELSDEEKKKIISQSVEGSKFNLNFEEDGEYEWEYLYKNFAGLDGIISSESGDCVHKFFIDTKSPVAKFPATKEHNAWNDLLTMITFNLFSKSEMYLSIDYADYESGIKEVKYYKHVYNEKLENVIELFTIENLNNLYKENKFVAYKGLITVNKDEKAVVYARVMDKAGNFKYVSSTGLVIDSKSPESVEFAPVEEKKIYNDAVKFKVNVHESDEKVFSGIKKVYYNVYEDISKKFIITSDNIIYEWKESENKFCREWSGEFVLDPKAESRYNKDNIYIEVVAVDNAGNELVSEGRTVSMNVDDVRSSLEFSDVYDTERRKGSDQFKSRTAFLTIENDRKSSFNEEAATKAIRDGIKAFDAEGKEIEVPDLVTITWKNDSNKRNTHVAAIEFNYDGNYVWENREYVNDAANSLYILNNPNKDYSISFTIDKTSPTASIAVDANVWSELLNFLTFGKYTTKDKYVVSATYADNINKIVYAHYFISTSKTPLSAEELDNVSDWRVYEEHAEIDITDPENYVVYLRATDGAGNYVYVSSDGHIIDKEAPELTLTPNAYTDLENDVYIYDASCGDTISINLSATDEIGNNPFSGIKQIAYSVKVNDEEVQRETIYSEEENSLTGSIDNKTIDINLANINSSDFTVYAEVTDHAGNVSGKEVKISFDISAPVISVSFDNNDFVNEKYFNKPRTATITIKERSSHFNIFEANKGIEITSNGQRIDTSGVTWETITAEKSDDDIHVAKIEFKDDAEYTFNVSYTDKIGNKNEDVSWNGIHDNFVIDKTAPTGSIIAASNERRDEWTNENLVRNIRFGFFSREYINISCTGNDNISKEDVSIEYYKCSSVDNDIARVKTRLTAEELDHVQWTPLAKEGISVIPDEQFVVYAKITDKAGNYLYLNTDGLIVDSNAPNQEFIAPEIEVTPEQTESGIYSSSVPVHIRVEDGAVNGTYSGINYVRYEVYSDDELTQSEDLYQFNYEMNDELKGVWEGDIIIDSAKNNSNNIRVDVVAVDNSGNGKQIPTPMKIDITPPTIDVSYDNNTCNSDGMFRNARTAEITVTERNFDERYFNIIVNGQRYNAEWSSYGGTGNGDDTIWKSKVLFNVDGDYTLDINCTDLASNKNTDVNFGDSVHPTKFTLDTSRPEISVEFIERNDMGRGIYYQNTRVAQITIEDAHFDAAAATEAVQCTMIVDGHDERTGSNVAILPISEWTNIMNTDKHIALIEMNKDAQYILNVQYTDMAGNISKKYSSEFYVDTKNPKTNLSVNGSSKNGAYSGNVNAMISYEDTNFDSNNVKFSMKGSKVDVSDYVIDEDNIIFTLTSKSGEKVEWKGKLESITDGNNKVYGQKIEFEDFPTGDNSKDFDDIYTLKLSVTDKSGRTTSKNLSFSINRFGSTYDISQISDVLGTYSKNSPEIVISEINPNELKEYSITLFKNNETINLNQGVDYDVDVKSNNKAWYEYKYTIPSSNFSEDGIYSISLYSVDEANNISENTLDTKKSEVSFAVDSTPPDIMVANLESNETYIEDKKQVIMTADDNLRLSEIEVYLDGSEDAFVKWNEEEITEILGKNNSEDREFRFDISGDSTNAHTMKVVCRDAAGNVTELKLENFYVTKDTVVELKKNNNFLFILIAVIVAAVGGVAVIATKRKKH